MHGGEICLLACRLPGANHAPSARSVLPAFINEAMQSYGAIAGSDGNSAFSSRNSEDRV